MRKNYYQKERRMNRKFALFLMIATGNCRAALIRVAMVNDAEQIASVHSAAFAATYKKVLSREVYEPMLGRIGQGRWEKYLKTPPDNSFLLVAEVQNKIVGFTVVSAQQNEDEFSKQAGCDCEITHLYVHPSFQQKGVGAQLIAEAKTHLKAQGCKHLFATTLEEIEASKIYLRKGATLLGSRECPKDPTVREVFYGFRLDSK